MVQGGGRGKLGEKKKADNWSSMERSCRPYGAGRAEGVAKKKKLNGYIHGMVGYGRDMWPGGVTSEGGASHSGSPKLGPEVSGEEGREDRGTRFKDDITKPAKMGDSPTKKKCKQDAASTEWGGK